MEYDTDENVPEDNENRGTGTSINYCCKHNCLSEFDDEFKSKLKYDLSLLSNPEKRIYLFALISINESRMCSSKKTKSTKYFEYTVKEYGISRFVCKTAFIALHGTTLSFVRTLHTKMVEGCLIPTDNRGKQQQRVISMLNTKALIKDHLFSILESPNVSFRLNYKPG